ncbi:MFS transporter [Bacillus taeanensis]|uniref:MFS transporter n=1 Tax=Bacillus taeanensis TaxID=273032 RepID=A0A366XSY7_9BACI|nr:MFS transporter [Bacillus taeanensis]RBW68668.1 MFS transporter [Bacillus taeanensis]
MRGQTSALVFSTLAMIAAFAAWAIISPMASTLQEMYGLTTIEKSFLVAAPVLLGSIMRIPMGILTDRLGGRKVYTMTMLFLVLPMVGAGFANSYQMLLVWALFIGMAGTTFAIAITYVSRWYPSDKQGLVLGITGMGNIGTAIAGFAIPTIVAMYNISWAFWSVAATVGIMAVIFWFSTKELPKPKEGKTFKGALSVLKFNETWILSLFYFLTFGGFVAFSIYLPTLMQDLFAISAVDAGLRAAGFVVIATLVRPIGGHLADRLRTGRLLTVIFSGIFICAFVLAFLINHFPLFSIGCLSIAFLVGAGNGAVFKLVPEISPGNTGAVTGIVGAAGGLGGFFPPIVLGAIRDLTGSYAYGFVLLALFTLLCLIINIRKFDSNKHQPNQVNIRF